MEHYGGQSEQRLSPYMMPNIIDPINDNRNHFFLIFDWQSKVSEKIMKDLDHHISWRRGLIKNPFTKDIKDRLKLSYRILNSLILDIIKPVEYIE